MQLRKIIEYLDELYPQSLKASYDNVGLMVGDKTQDVKKVLLALDLTKEVLNEAIDNKCDLIITHHPLLFHPLYSINKDDDISNICMELIKNNISNFSLHTNFDSVKMNDYLSSLIGLKNKEVLSFKENCGVYGYTDEIVASEYIKHILKCFNIKNANYYGDLDAKIKKVAIVGGSGSSFFNDCIINNCDLYITGDINYSRGVEANRLKLNVLDVGHFIEKLYVNVIKEDLYNLDKNIEVIISNIDPIPYKTITI